MSKIKVKHNPQGMLAVLNSPDIQKALEEVGTEIALKAKASAPVESGAYRDSIDSTVEKGTDRWVAYVYADAEHASVIEARTGNLLKAAMGGGAE